MILKHARLFNDAFDLTKADIAFADGKITQIAPDIPGEGMDCTGCVILPGLIDIHIHGCFGADFADASAQSLETMSQYLASQGVTSFCPASMTQPEVQLSPAFAATAAYMGQEAGAYIHGVNMEGPFLSHARKGAQPGEFIREPDLAEFDRLRALCPVSMVDVAPEAPGAFAFARAASQICTVAAAHTAAPYELAVDCLQNGFTHTTHLFNGMDGIFPREPGVATAILDDDRVTAELICDGRHIYPALLRIAFRLLGEDRAVVVSDAMKASGLGDGVYDLGGQTVYVNDGRATLADGSFAASTSNVFEELRNILSYGIPVRQAVKACTINPARVIGKDQQTGSLLPEKSADILVLDETMQEIRAVFIQGKQYC